MNLSIVFVANFMNHHQLPFSLKMNELTEGNYLFVAMSPLPNEQRTLGYADMNDYEFVIKAYESNEQYELAKKKIVESDMVIFGSCPNELISLRSDADKPFIIYSERFFKKGTYRRFIPITRKKIYNRLLKYESHNPLVICSSAYLPYDLKLLNANFTTYKWGYFPAVKKYDDIQKIIESKQPISILWVARFIKWKHPEIPVKIAKRLKANGYNFELNMIGNGERLPKIEKLIERYDLADCVHLLGSMSPEEVRNNMEKSEIFLFTSDKNEGWGAVINEAMNSLCVVVANYEVGSIPFLIENGKNGVIYSNRCLSDLYNKITALIDNEQKRENLAINAYKTIFDKWNSEEATERLFAVIESVVNGQAAKIYDDNGPCSLAETIVPKKFGRNL